LKSEFELGHGHAMAIVAYFKQKGYVFGQKIAKPK
jgi:hypothetical protein